MTSARRDYLKRLRDHVAGVDDVVDAARRYVIEGCRREHHDDRGKVTSDPDYCICPENAGALEFAAWLAFEVGFDQRRPEHIRPAGQPNRKREGETRMVLAAAG